MLGPVGPAAREHVDIAGAPIVAGHADDGRTPGYRYRLAAVNAGGERRDQFLLLVDCLRRREARQGGKSRWTFSKKMTYLIDGMLSYSYAPLRMMSLVGLFFACCGFLYAVLIAIFRMTGALPRLGLINPLMVVVLVMGGTQMLMLGIIGEYIWRTLAQSRDRPLYIVDRVYESTRDEGSSNLVAREGS